MFLPYVADGIATFVWWADVWCVMVSYDVTALFTSVPIPPILKIIEDKLDEDKD